MSINSASPQSAQFMSSLTPGFRRAPLLARRSENRCSVARELKLHRLKSLKTAKS